MKIDVVTVELGEDACVEPAFENSVVIGLSCSNAYAPYCGVLIQSIICNASAERNYDILVMERAISSANKRMMVGLAENYPNISIRFINVLSIVSILPFALHEHFPIDNAMKLFFATDFFKKYEKIVCTDSDLVFLRDAADLFDTPLSDAYMAAVPDIIMKSNVVTGRMAGGEHKDLSSSEYITEFLKIEKSDDYLNTGVCVFNLAKMQAENKFQMLIKMAGEHKLWYSERDALNATFCYNSIHLNSKWNVHGAQFISLIRDSVSETAAQSLEEDIDDPYVMHFSSKHKPWLNAALINSELFYRYARMTPWYERILAGLIAGMRNAVTAPMDRKIEVRYREFREFRDNAWRVCLKSFIKDVLRKSISSQRYEALKAMKKRWKLQKKYRIESNRHIKENQRLATVPGTEEFENRQHLRALKNKYTGKRCFIVGAGPSLTLEDLNKLNGEITFSLNNIHKIFEETTWRPTFYVNNDIALLHGEEQERIQSLTACLRNYEFEGVFLSSSKHDKELRDIYPEGKPIYFLNAICDVYQIRMPEPYYFSKDCSKQVYMHGTTLFVIAQLIRYMGFSEVYLLGTDASYAPGTKNHIYKATAAEMRAFRTSRQAKSASDWILKGFADIRYHLTERGGVPVYNATRGGALELFPRVDLDEVLARKE